MSEAIANWVPPSILVGMLLGGIAIFYQKLDKLLDKIDTRLNAIERQLNAYATIEQLGRMGDRLDGRATNNSERIAVLEALGRR